METIVLVPLGGLCNRLRAILSALAWARDSHTTLEIVWLRDAGLNARFSDLFEPLTLPDELKVTKARVTESDSWLRYGVARKQNLWLPAIYQRCAFNVRLKDEIRGHLHGRVLVQTGYSFYPAKDEWLKILFHPSAAVEALLQQRLPQITSHTVGVHIRQTDNRLSLEYSPLSAFEAAMQRDLDRDPEVEFYVATDNPTLLPVLSKQFPICYSTTAPSRDSVRGMQEAVAELWTLMSCPRFHGSYWSSFSDTVVALSPNGDIVARK